MRIQIDLESLLAPIPGDAPAGEDLRYSKVYDDIKEARRADDVLPQGQWQRDIKTSDWKKVITLSIQALTERTKDLQIAAWLTEALALTEGFEGAEAGMKVLAGLLGQYWDTVFPIIEEEDYDYRVAPFEFLNDKLVISLKQIPLTEPGITPGYSLLKWQESHDTTRKDQDKISADEFAGAVAKSSVTFYKTLQESLSRCLETFKSLDAVIDETFGTHAPRISDMGQVLEECLQLVTNICREQKGITLQKGPEPESASSERAEEPEISSSEVAVNVYPVQAAVVDTSRSGVQKIFPAPVSGDISQEEQLWEEALGMMQQGGVREALSRLLAISNCQPSERSRYRYQFLVAKLCLKAGKPELARPIMEQLFSLINELHLERWESPSWIAEVFESLHQCLVSGEPGSEDKSRSQELFKKICTLDVTKALNTK